MTYNTPQPDTFCHGCGIAALDEFAYGRRRIRLCRKCADELATAFENKAATEAAWRMMTDDYGDERKDDADDSPRDP
jgi:hypothetical protein